MMDLQKIFLHLIKNSLHGPTPHMGITIRTTENQMINAQISDSIDMIEIDLEMDLLTTRMGTGETMVNFSRFPSTQRRKFSQNNSYRQPRSDQRNNSVFRRYDNRPTTGFTPYEHKFPRNNNRTAFNVVRFTTSDDTINELSDL